MEKPPTWLGIYQALMWYEPVNWLGFDALRYQAARKAKDFDLANRIKATEKGLETRPSRESKDR